MWHGVLALAVSLMGLTTVAGNCVTCKKSLVNTHFGEVLSGAPRGLCCPSRRSAILSQPTNSSRVPVQYGGSVLLQDSRLSVGVAASLDASLFGADEVVQMHLFARQATSCRIPHNCTLDDVLVPDAVRVLIGSGVARGGPLRLSSFHMLPLGALRSSVGHALAVCFSGQGAPSATAAPLFGQLYGPPLSVCRFPAFFPARISH